MYNLLPLSSQSSTFSPQLMSLTTNIRRFFRRVFRQRGKQSKPPSPLFAIVLTALIIFFARYPSLNTLSDHLPVIARDYIQQQTPSTIFIDEVGSTTPPLSSLSSVSLDSIDSGQNNLQSRVDAIVKHAPSAHAQLKSVYLLPSSVVDAMSTSLAERLYWKLVYVDVVNALQASSVSSKNQSSPYSNFRTKARVLFIHTQNGLGNRLRSLASGLAMARATNRIPVIVWEQDPHLGARYSDLFQSTASGSDLSTVLYKNLLCMESFPEWPVVHQRTKHWHPVNYMEKDGLSARPGISLEFSNIHSLSDEEVQMSSSITHDMHVYFKSAYVANTTPSHVSTRRSVNKELTNLRPTQPILKVFSKIDLGTLKKSIGVHIRSRTLSNDNVEVSTNCEYTTEGAAMTDYWRSRSQLPVFVQKMKSALKREKDVSFFVAADDVSVIRELERTFPGRILSIPRECDDRNGSCVIYAMADLMCLARTRKIYGSRWSSFTEVAARLGNKPLFLSGYHFGVQRGWPRTLRYVYAKVELRLRKLWLGSNPLQGCNMRR